MNVYFEKMFVKENKIQYYSSTCEKLYFIPMSRVINPVLKYLLKGNSEYYAS